VFDIHIDDATDRHLLIHLVKTQEKMMSDFSKLNADIADLSAKVDALIAKQAPPPIDEQPAVDAAAAAVEAIVAKIPA
jgi:hypothetical protein